MPSVACSEGAVIKEKVLDDELVQFFILRGIARDLTYIECSDLILLLGKVLGDVIGHFVQFFVLRGI